MISLLVCSRISGNKNFSLLSLLETLERMSSSHKNFEVLVKFDSDDKRFRRILPKLNTYPFRVRHIIEPRGRGYIDLHVYYNRLLSLADKRSVVIGAMADDFEIIQQGWDEIIISKTRVFPDQIFIIHGRPHPPSSREDYGEKKFYLDFDIDKLEDIAIIDESPFWSRKLLNICGGLGQISFTDAWTLYLEYLLFHRYGINRTLFTEQPVVYRKLHDGIDQPVGSRWWTHRRYNFEFMRSCFYKTLVEHQALNVYLNIKSGIKIPEQQSVLTMEKTLEPSADSVQQRRLFNAYRRKYYRMKFLEALQKLTGPEIYSVFRKCWYSLKGKR